MNDVHAIGVTQLQVAIGYRVNDLDGSFLLGEQGIIFKENVFDVQGLKDVEFFKDAP